MSKTSTRNWIKGSAREITFGNGGSIINLSLNFDELEKLPREKGYIRISVASKESPDNYGNTHSVYENDFVPDKSKAGTAKSSPASRTQESTDDDLPF